MSNVIKQLKKDLSKLSAKFLKEGKEEDFREYQKKRKELMKEEIETHNYNIAEDMGNIAEDFKEKYPSISSDALKLVDDYSTKAKGEK